MLTKTDVSVVIPCYPPHIKHLHSLISSLYKHTLIPDEIIVAVSESTNELLDFKSTFPIVKVITTIEKKTAGENRNRGADVAISKYIAFFS